MGLQDYREAEQVCVTNTVLRGASVEFGWFGVGEAGMDAPDGICLEHS